MSKRLQVLFEERELKEIQRLARGQRMTTAEWVRQTLRAGRRGVPGPGARKRLDAIRVAAKHRFPTAGIDVMLEQIERGYGETSR